MLTGTRRTTKEREETEMNTFLHEISTATVLNETDGSVYELVTTQATYTFTKCRWLDRPWLRLLDAKTYSADECRAVDINLEHCVAITKI